MLEDKIFNFWNINFSEATNHQYLGEIFKHLNLQGTWILWVFDDVYFEKSYLHCFSILESDIQQLSWDLNKSPSKQWYNLVLIFQPPRMQPSQMKV